MVNIQSATAEIRQGKKKKEEEERRKRKNKIETTDKTYNTFPVPYGGHNNSSDEIQKLEASAAAGMVVSSGIYGNLSKIFSLITYVNQLFPRPALQSDGVK